MASITFRNLDDSLKIRLRIRADVRGQQMQAEPRDIPPSALNRKPRVTPEPIREPPRLG